MCPSHDVVRWVIGSIHHGGPIELFLVLDLKKAIAFKVGIGSS